VATGEDQPEAVVGHGGLVDRVVVAIRDGRDRLELGQLVGVATVAAQAVDRAVTGGRRDPRARVARRAVARPAGECELEGVLNGVLGEVEVAEDADQGRDRAPGLVPERAGDVVAGRGYALCAPAAAWIARPAAS
jgi:hypothetical protein